MSSVFDPPPSSPSFDTEGRSRKVSQLLTDTVKIHCKNGCGYYGNPGWDGFCSKCWQEKQEANAEEASTLPDSAAPESERTDKKGGAAAAAASPAKKARRRWVFRSSSRNDVDRPRLVSDVSTQASSDFAEFLKTLDKRTAVDLSRQVKQFHDAFRIKAENLDPSSEDMEQEIQDFYSDLQQRVFTHPAYKFLGEDTVDHLFEFVEKYLLTKLYPQFFNPLYAEWEERDLELQAKIRSFNWVTPEHLDAQHLVGSSDGDLFPAVGDSLDKAIAAIVEMDAQRSPQDKLHAILGCAAFIHDAVEKSVGRLASADDFLPLFLYVILQANPPMLHSNIDFISRFSLPQRVREGETGYFFTNLCIAVDFILHHLNNDTLNMSKRDFSRAMNGDVLHNSLASRRKSEGLKNLVNNFNLLASLQQRQEKLKADAVLLQQEIRTWNEETSNKWKMLQQ